MIRIHRRPGRLLVAMALAAAATGARAGAQDRQRARSGSRDLIDRIETGEAAPRPRPVGVNDEFFNHWVFGSEGAEDFRRRSELSLTARVSDVDRICPLTAEQKKKLLLAGRGDIKRFFDRVEVTRKKLDRESLDRAERQTILQDFPRRRTSSRLDLFGEKSLFAKALKNTLTAEQLARFQKVTRDQVVARHRTTVTWVVGIMDTTLGLSKEQHRQLEELIAKETRPPRRFGEYDYYGVMFQVSRLPETSLRPIFDQDQWGKLSLQLAEAVRLERTLKDEGYVPDDRA